MTRTTRIIELVDAHLHQDDERFATALASIIRELRARQHHHAADQLGERLRTAPTGTVGTTLKSAHEWAGTAAVLERSPACTDPGGPDQPRHVVHEVAALKTIHSLLLSRQTSTCALGLARELRAEDGGARPGSVVVLEGRHGNGRSSLAEAIAHHAGRPLRVVDGATLSTMTPAERHEALRAARARRATDPCVTLFDDIGTTSGASEDTTGDTAQAKALSSRVIDDVLDAVTAQPTPGLTILVFASPPTTGGALRLPRLPHIHLPAPAPDTAGVFLRRQGLLLGTRTELADFARSAVSRSASYGDLESLARNVRQLELLLPGSPAADAVHELLDGWQPRQGTADVRGVPEAV